MKEYGLQEPEFIDMEIALRINLYRNVLDDELNVEAPQSAGEALQSAGEVPEKCRKLIRTRSSRRKLWNI